MNVIVVMGRLTNDPNTTYGANGFAISRFGIAVDRRYKKEGQPEADFFNCVAFGKTAEFTSQYLCKGIKVVISGNLQNNNYQGKDGNMVYGQQIVANSIEFAESKAASDAYRQQAAPSAPRQQPMPTAGPVTGPTPTMVPQSPQPSQFTQSALPSADDFMKIPDSAGPDGFPFV